MLCIIETHPIQYHAPVWRSIQQDFKIPVIVIYGSDFSIAGYHDKEFGANFAWQEDLLSGYRSIFLSKVAEGGASCASEVKCNGLEKIIFDEKIKAILLVGYSPRFYWDAFKLSRKTRRPILFRAETTDSSKKRNIFSRKIRDFFLVNIYNACSLLLPVGNQSEAHYLRLGFSKKLKFRSPYCVETSPFRTSETDRIYCRELTRDLIGVSQDSFVVIYCGKLSYRKGVDFLLEGLISWSEETKQSTVLLCVGDGEEKILLAERSKNNPYVKVIVTGFKQQHELSAFYHASDVLCLPSREGETWGLVVNEALHHGLPVMVSDSVGCYTDLVQCKGTGQVFSSGNLSQLKESLKKCFALKGDFEIRKKCRDVVSTFGVRDAAKGIADAYSYIVNQSI